MVRNELSWLALVLSVVGVASCESQPLQIGSAATVNGPASQVDGNATETESLPAPMSMPRIPGTCEQPADAGALRAECSALVPCGADVRLVFKAGPPPDLGQGGWITDGDYDLVEVTIYQSAPTNDVFTDRESIRISYKGQRLEYVTASDGFTISESIGPRGKWLNPITLCPGSEVSVGPYFTATPDKITIFNELYVKVFTRRN
jgi:hypothetical protein